ncbi:MAG TPA: TIM-barrel domain-containing protein [Lachnospiraceae bacterium]|nr:TIM-barrel domain-containing protein [Lachnospiraceae bacterium]
MDSDICNNSLRVYTRQITGNIVKVTYTYDQVEPEYSNLITEEMKRKEGCKPERYSLLAEGLAFKNDRDMVILKETGHYLEEKDIFRYLIDGKPVMKVKQTANGEVAYIENARKELVGKGFEGKLTFEVGTDECFYGLGQHEDGIYNYRDKKEYLIQTNMKISIPFLISSENYGILIDTESAVKYESKDGKITFTIDTVKELTYYIITGNHFDEIIYNLRELTGRAPMLPRWAFGYIQSKERYQSSEELLDTVDSFRSRKIPIDCIVQDWLTWEEGLWGEKRVDRKRFPDLDGLVQSLHHHHVKLMVSIWPNMTEGGQNLEEFRKKDLLLPATSIYNAYDEEARDIYWQQCEEEWFKAGIDAWWCDNAEPFSDPDWSGEVKKPDELRYQMITEESKKSVDAMQINSYALMHSKGIYENWRRTNKDKRVVNLSRSSYISGQRYGCVLWSGDISAKWSTYRKQITEGIKFCMSGMPYWTLDIGGFFTVKDKWENRGCNSSGNANKLWFWDGDYNNGVNDLGYRELYVRWFQFATFLPMLRAHGTDTPREPWNFGSPGEFFYDTIIKFIHLRYRLLPYTYSLAAMVNRNHFTMLRSLLFDFAFDEKVRELSDSFLFGKALLVCPVTEPMYYGADSVVIERSDMVKEVYLPKGADWYDYWTGAYYVGGQSIRCKAPLDRLPLFVRAGSILPVSDPIEYADESNGEVSELLIYTGEDCEFTLYNDEGDNYSYEEGNYSAIPICYREEDRSLTFGKAMGCYAYQENFRIRTIEPDGKEIVAVYRYKGEEGIIRLYK